MISKSGVRERMAGAHRTKACSKRVVEKHMCLVDLVLYPSCVAGFGQAKLFGHGGRTVWYTGFAFSGVCLLCRQYHS